MPSRTDPIPGCVKVMHVITRMVKGGAQENTLANVAGIGGDGWASSLITGPAEGPEGSLEPECLAAGIRMLHVPELTRELSPLKDVKGLGQLKAIFRAERPHIVHTHTSKAGILGRIAARAVGVPIVVHTPHGHVFHSYESGMKTRLFIAAEKWCAPKADRLIALTDTELREHLELGIGRPDQWTTVHSGVDFAPFEAARGERESVWRELGIPAEAAVIGTVGRLVPIKGQSYLVEAFARLASRFPTAHLLLVGDGELRNEIVSQARGLGLAVREHDLADSAAPASAGPTIHLTGLRRDVPRLMSAMDVLALPSLNEGMGRVLVEAMSMELPCVGSRVSGIPDVIDEGVTGLLVPARDPIGLAEALGRLLSDGKAAREMGRRGRARAVPGFSREYMLEKLESLYLELLHRKGIAPAASRTRG